ncbi:MAG: hypothetical protein JKY94_09880 [Rhodobacteraceae bacterium]|nr:hypothetical protein [Paracoccaceae bacterium]
MPESPRYSSPTAGENTCSPTIVVCWECKRIGVYTCERFAELVGPDTVMPDALRVLASRTCERARQPLGALDERCGIAYYRWEL